MTPLQWTAWSISLAACLAALGWALFWDRYRGRLRCPKCWYDMLGTAGRTCPECGRTVRRDRDWRRTRRRWKTAIGAMLLAPFIAIVPFWQWIAVRFVDRLPDTVLILILASDRIQDPIDAVSLEEELYWRLRASPLLCVQRWNRDALWRWQWRLIASRYEAALAHLQSVADVFAQAPPAQAPILTHEDMLALDRDASGARFGELVQRLQWPADAFLPGYVSNLSVKSLDVKAADGGPGRVYLVSSFQRFWLVATQKVEGQWRFAGAYDIWSKYADPHVHNMHGDDTIVELSSISTGGTGTQTGAAGWCRIDQRGLHFVHAWCTGGHESYGGGPFNHEFKVTSPVMGSDERGRFVDHTLRLTVSNADVSWEDDDRCDPADVAAVADLGDVFERTGRIRCRWSESAGRFELSEAESQWTPAQMNGSFSDDSVFITQNFDTLVSLATGDDPARRAWVRLMLARLEDSPEKTRLVRVIQERAK